MNYSNISDDVSHLVRDASYDLAEDRHLALMQDPGQRWTPRGRFTQDEEPVLESIFD